MIHEIVQIQEIDFQLVDPLVLDHLRFHYHVIILVLDIVIVTENSTLTKLHHVQDSRNFIKNEEIPDVFIILLLEILVIIFLNPTL